MTLRAFRGLALKLIIATANGMTIRMIDLTDKRNQKDHEVSGAAGRSNISCNSL